MEDPIGTHENHNTSGTQVGSAHTPPTPSELQTEGPQPTETPSSNPTPNLTPTPSSQAQEAAPSSQQEVGKRKPARLPSNAWSHFTKDGDRASCNYCGKTYTCNNTNHDTTKLIKHLKVCAKNPHREVDKKQKTIAFGKLSEDDPNSAMNMKLVEFNQEQCRHKLCKMIVIDELPFRFVDNPGFRGFMSAIQPRFRMPGRMTIARDIMQRFIEEKMKLKSILSCNQQMVSLTIDTWTSIQNMNYMCVTAHFIDDGWELHKKILSFELIADHRGETIGKSLEKCLKDWGILKISTITVDNANANNSVLAYLVRGMQDWNGCTLLKGELMYMRCCAHILNLIVNDGLKELDCSVARIRDACKYVRSSPSRLTTFRRCAQEVNVVSNQMLTLDVPTRWDSTYLMLEVAEQFEKAFNRLEYEDQDYLHVLESEGGPPNYDDWNRARAFIKFLKIFYDATLAFCDSLHVTSNTFFHKLCEIQNSLTVWIGSDDVVLQRMAINMKAKFDKYWNMNENLKFLLFVAIFLDPRYKLDYVEFCFSEMYGQEKCKEIVKKMKDFIKSLFAQYVTLYPIVPDARDSSVISSNVSKQTNVGGSSEGGFTLEDKFRLKLKKKQGEQKKNELYRYMEDDVEDNYEGFDILKWWKGKTMKYNILSCMARDILAIPVATVSSESIFSTGGRILDPFRSSLNPTTVEALICTQNWLRLPQKVDDLRSQMEEIERVESKMLGVAGLQEVEVASDFRSMRMRKGQKD